MDKIEILGRPIQFVATAAFNEKYGGLEAQMYTKMALKALKKKPVDMLIFEQPEPGKLQVRSAGYDLETDSELDETTVITKVDSLHIETFWFKLDLLENKYVGTFLFPSDY